MISLNTGCSAHDFVFPNHKTLVKLGITETIVLCVIQERFMVWGRGFYEGFWRHMVSCTTALFGSMASFFLPLAAIVIHCIYVIMSAMASQNTGISIVFLTVCSYADQRKYQSSASLAFVRGLHRWPMNSQHEGPATLKIFPFHLCTERLGKCCIQAYTWTIVHHIYVKTKTIWKLNCLSWKFESLQLVCIHAIYIYIHVCMCVHFSALLAVGSNALVIGAGNVRNPINYMIHQMGFISQTLVNSHAKIKGYPLGVCRSKRYIWGQ